MNIPRGTEAGLFLMKDLIELLELKLSDDGLSARLRAVGAYPSAAAVSVDDLIEFLDRKNVVFGIDQEQLTEFLRLWSHPDYDPSRAEPITIAQGTTALPPSPPTLRRLHPPVRSGHNPVQLLPLYVAKGEAIFIEEEPKPGKPGQKVTGEVVPIPNSSSQRPRLGPGISHEENRWVATRSGFLSRDGDIIMVSTTLHHHRDLPAREYHWTGNVRIVGNLLSGVELIVGGSVEIQGDVHDKVRIRCHGDVNIRGQISGTGTRITARGQITVGGLQGAQLMADQDVILMGDAEYARIRTHSNFIAIEHQSVIKGSRIEAVRGARIRSISDDPTGQKTSVTVGVSEWLDEEFRALDDEIQRWQTYHQKIYADFQNQYRELLEDRTKIHKLPQAMRAQYENAHNEVLNEQKRIDEKMSALKTQQIRLQERRNRDESAVITILDRVEAGSRFSVRGRAYSPESDLTKPTTLFVHPDTGRVHAMPTALYESSELYSVGG